MTLLLSKFGAMVSYVFSSLGSYFLFCAESFRRIFFPPLSFKLILQQMEFVGARSLVIIIMAAIMVGAVFGIQFGHIFRIFGVESLIGTAASFSLSKELSPVIGSFLVTGRAGSAMAAEIANMKINEQIDAMKVMAVNPVAYLASPRIVASILMVPLLAGFFTVFGVLSAYVIGVLLFDVDTGIFIDKIRWLNKPSDIVEGLQKAAIFGAIYSSVSCYKGFQARGGAQGVGRATTEAVVISLVIILVSDYFLSYLQMRGLLQ
ncbi:MAG: ABC transporter permease [Deltaproteobacteria bacterium]|nr:ABC transporter permease [Deltaproteobacteria bacterium]